MSPNQKRPYVRVSFDGLKTPLSLEEFRAITGKGWKVTEVKWRALFLSKPRKSFPPGSETRFMDLELLVATRRLLLQHQSSVRVLVDDLEPMTFEDFRATLGPGWKRAKAEWQSLCKQQAKEGPSQELNVRLAKLQWLANVRQHLRYLSRKVREERRELLERRVRILL